MVQSNCESFLKRRRCWRQVPQTRVHWSRNSNVSVTRRFMKHKPPLSDIVIYCDQRPAGAGLVERFVIAKRKGLGLSRSSVWPPRPRFIPKLAAGGAGDRQVIAALVVFLN